MSLCLFLLPDRKNHLPENLWKKGTWPSLSHPPARMDKVCVEVVVTGMQLSSSLCLCLRLQRERLAAFSACRRAGDAAEGV